MHQSPASQPRVEAAHSGPSNGQALAAPERLAALAASELLDSAMDEAFDRLTRLVTKLLDAPVSILSLVDDHRQFFKSQQGLPEPVATTRETPLSHSFCRHVVTSGEPFVVSDAHAHPLVRDNGAVTDLGVVAYAGMPVRDPQGFVLGSLCAIDERPRDWTDDQLATLRDLADATMTEIALTAAITQARQVSTRLAETNDELRGSQARHAAVVEAALDCIVVVDDEGIVIEFNPAAEKTFGYRREDAIGRPLAELMVPRDLQTRHQWHLARMRDGDPGLLNRRMEGTLVRRDGTELPAEWSITRAEVAGQVLLSAHIRDITDRRQAARRIEHLALHDQLTGLPNRTQLEQRFHEVRRRCDRSGAQLGVMYLDLDHFKQVNDGLGHAAGDDVLLQVNHRIQEVLQDGHLLTRFGGDEFVILLEGLDVPPQRAAQRVARDLLSALEAPFTADGSEVRIGASIGISIYPEDGDDLGTLLQHADAAMYLSKRSGRGIYSTYRAGVEGEMTLTTAARLRRAITDGQLRVHYQPVRSLADGRFVGAEALVRWEDPERGLVGPGAFIPLAEETGLIEPIGEWVLERALEQLVDWRREGLDTRLSFNVSPRQLRRSDFVRRLLAAIRRHSIDPSQLAMEVTEAVAMEETGLMERMLHRVRDLGVWIALDDFGSGYSSLTRLRRLPIDVLKLDRQLLAGAPEDEGAVHLVRASIAMAQGLGLMVVAEGVETQAQEEFLAAEGCPLAQGYFFARPVPATEVSRLLRDVGGGPSRARPRPVAAA